MRFHATAVRVMFESRFEQTAIPFIHLKIGRKREAAHNLFHESNEKRQDIVTFFAFMPGRSSSSSSPNMRSS